MLGLHLANVAGTRFRTLDALVAQETLYHTLLLVVLGNETSLVADMPTAGILTTSHLERAQPTGAGLRPFIKIALPKDTILNTKTAVILDTTNVDLAQPDTRTAVCQGEALV